METAKVPCRYRSGPPRPVGLLISAFEACTRTSSATSAETVCRPPQLNDASVLAFVLLLLLLLWPDLSHFAAFGVSVKRRADSAERAAMEARDRVAEVQSLLVNQLTSSSASASNVLYFNAPGAPGKEQLDEVVRDTESRSSEASPGPAEDRPQFFGPDTADPDQVESALLGAEIIKNWETIRRRLDYPSSIQRISDAPRRSDEWTLAAEQRVLALDYKRELDVLRAVRNSIAHGIPVEIDDLREARELSRRILEQTSRVGRR